MLEDAKNDYKVLRFFNWVFALLIFSGVILTFISSKTISIYLVMSLVFILAIFFNYIFTAIAISPNIFIFFGYPVLITKDNSKALNALIVSNFLFSVFGLIIIIACVSTKQYPASISGFLYLALSGLNVKALIQCKA